VGSDAALQALEDCVISAKKSVISHTVAAPVARETQLQQRAVDAKGASIKVIKPNTNLTATNAAGRMQ
jgi:hypothetical protein